LKFYNLKLLIAAAWLDHASRCGLNQTNAERDWLMVCTYEDEAGLII
jgi:hypothetical protein